MINLQSCGFFSYPKNHDKGNQDAYLLPVQLGSGFVFAVADGVGSYNGAKEVANLVTSTISSIDAGDAKDIEKTLFYVKNRVDQFAASQPDMVNAATTLSYCFIDDNSLYIGHVGDTRVYIKKNNKLKLVTKDHTQHQKLLDDGIYTKRELRDMPGKNTLTSALSKNLTLRFQSVKLPLSEIFDEEGLVNIYIMSDGAHHFWEQRPRFSEGTLNNPNRFASSLLKRIEKASPIDDHTIVSARFRVY
ncbi:PP2C family protein-serine/threonine phosphatase [Serratia liquefaciens]|uniref:PP2C family protein-serine/threonine phosphatase n=1 Tax=Serratia liquefaciens TaxID=614 RepID=UPI00165D09E0|nr:protein phosphatase 2C domain-containing protein [Serratia liquefaciens]QNQ52317.1 protein phosphatase 2C domain-containing protein [Serratia liquefaciens]